MGVVTRIEEHWDSIFSINKPRQLSWYEESPVASLELIKKCNLAPEASILLAGAGTTTLLYHLVERGYHNIVVNDISQTALDQLKKSLNKDRIDQVTWIKDDIIKPQQLNKLTDVDLWFDRAVLHFFTDRKEREAYMNLVKSVVKPAGYVILAVFNLQSADKCSGLPVYRYDLEMLQEGLGKKFSLMESFNYTFRMPSGDQREYIYSLFKRIC